MILVNTRLNGVYYRESHSKKFNSKPDRCFYIKFYHNKKQIQEKIGWLSEGFSAQFAANVRLERLANQTFKNNTMVFDEAAKLYIEWAKNVKKSFRDDESRYNFQIKSFFGNMKISEIKTLHIHDFISHLKGFKTKYGKSYALATITHYIILIRRIFNFLKQSDRYSGDNPAIMSKVKLEKFDNTKIAYLTDEEMAELINVCDNTNLIWPPDGAFIKFALYTGLRRSELFNLTWANVDLDKGVLRLTETKGKKNETIILSKSALSVLKTMNISNNYVFLSRKGGKRNDIRRLWNRIRKLAKIRTDIRFHDIRHNFGTMAVTNGVPIDVLQKMMTHKDIKTTQRYAHIVDQRLKEGANTIDMAFRNLKNND